MDELLENMPEMPFTAYYVVKHYVQTGKDTDALYAGIAGESGVVFIELTEFYYAQIPLYGVLSVWTVLLYIRR